MADELWTTRKVLAWTQRRFADRGLASPRLDAELLLAQVLGGSRIQLYTHHDQPLAPTELARYRELIKRRLAGEPVAYLLGEKEFFSLALRVDERVLVPRPETELLVEAVLAFLAGRSAPRVADLGTGSGAIAVAIAHQRPDATVIAVDCSAPALEVARENLHRHGVTVELRHGDLLAPLAGEAPFDVLAANLPYVADGDRPSLSPEVLREPPGALFAGADGLAVIRRLIAGAGALLVGDGLLALEIGATQGSAVAALCREAGLPAVEVRRDLAGLERLVLARRAGQAPEPTPPPGDLVVVPDEPADDEPGPDGPTDAPGEDEQTD